MSACALDKHWFSFVLNFHASFVCTECCKWTVCNSIISQVQLSIRIPRALVCFSFVQLIFGIELVKNGCEHLESLNFRFFLLNLRFALLLTICNISDYNSARVIFWNFTYKQAKKKQFLSEIELFFDDAHQYVKTVECLPAGTLITVWFRFMSVF